MLWRIGDIYVWYAGVIAGTAEIFRGLTDFLSYFILLFVLLHFFFCLTLLLLLSYFISSFVILHFFVLSYFTSSFCLT